MFTKQDHSRKQIAVSEVTLGFNVHFVGMIVSGYAVCWVANLLGTVVRSFYDSMDPGRSFAA